MESPENAAQPLHSLLGLLVAALAVWLVRFYVRRSQTINYMAQFPGRYEPVPFADLVEISRYVSRRARETGLPSRVLFYEQLQFFMMEHVDDGVCVRYLNGTPEVFVFRAEYAERILSHRSNITKGYPYDKMLPIIGRGLLLSTGAAWKTHRRMLTPAFHFRILGDFVHAINSHSRVLVDLLAAKGPEEDVLRYISAFTLDVICETVMSSPLQCQTTTAGQVYLDSLHRLSELYMARMSNPLLWSDLVFGLSPQGREQAKLLQSIRSFCWQVLQDRMAELEVEHADPDNQVGDDGPPRTKKPFIDILIREYREGHLTLAEARDEVSTVMFAGHDTTSVSIAFTVYLLGLHPDVQARLHDEVDAVLGPEEADIEPDQLKAMCYLDMVLKESLRLFPPGPMLSRKLDEAIKIDGKTIPAGVHVHLGISRLHRDPRVFPNPDVFDPERFTPENCRGRHPFAFVPFSAGPRNCIGSRLAQLQLKTAMCWLLRRFKWTSLDPLDTMVTSPDLVLRPVHRVRVDFSERRA